MNEDERITQLLKVPPFELRKSVVHSRHEHKNLEDIKEYIRATLEIDQAWGVDDKTRAQRGARGVNLVHAEYAQKSCADVARDGIDGPMVLVAQLTAPGVTGEEILVLQKRLPRFRNRFPPKA